MAAAPLAKCLLRVAAVALLAASLAFTCRKAERSAAVHGTHSLQGERSRFQGATPLDCNFRVAYPWERRQDRFQIWTKNAKLLEPLRRLPFTPVLSCEPGVSVLMDRFDWQLVPLSAWDKVETDPNAGPGALTCGLVDEMPWKNLSGSVRDPRTVWAAPHALKRLIEFAERDFDPSHSRRSVVFSGTETPMSSFFGDTHEERLSNVRRLRKYFSVINVMTKDIVLDGVGVAPMGLAWGYTISFMDYWIKHSVGLGKTYIASRYMSFETNISLSVHNKTKGMLATRGVWAGWLDRNRTIAVAESYIRRGILYPPSNSSNKAIIQAVRSRLALRQWSESAAAVEAGVELRLVPLVDWWGELPKYRFLLNPLGSAIQTAKSVEALLVLTVPVIERTGYKTHDELVALGFPFVMVNRWSDVTKQKADKWWEELSPRLESFRSNCLTVDGYWGMFIGTIPYCS